jgi:hypothetical protein
MYSAAQSALIEQLVLHAAEVWSHAKGAQLAGVGGALQAPVPLQRAGGVSTSPLQDAGAHVVEFPGNVQAVASMPSQVP